VETMTVEDGTGIEDADSYVTIAYATSYFSTRGITTFAELTESEQEILLIKATDYIDNVFEWNGVREYPDVQTLRFPRTKLYDYEGQSVTGVPKAIKDAVCEAVLILLDDTDLYQTESENGAVTSEKIGQLAFTYDVSQKIIGSTLFESINYRLRGLYKDNSKNRILCGNVRRV